MKYLLKCLWFFVYYKSLPDRTFLYIHFYRRLGYSLLLRNPITFNQKIQWLKLNDRREINKLVADKFEVRNLIAGLVGEDYLIPLIGIYDTIDQFDLENFTDFPVVVKSTVGCGQVLILRSKTDIDNVVLKGTVDEWFSIFSDIYPYGKEWQYKGLNKRIIVERLLLENDVIPNDYKFHCFNGKVEFIYVSIDREGVNKRAIYNRNWEKQDICWGRDIIKFHNSPEIPEPKNLQKMIALSEKISDIFLYIRVDMYLCKENIYIGELTLHHGSGFDPFVPSDYDLYFGSFLDLKQGKR